MTIRPEKNKSLKAMNTFGFDQRAELFLRVSSEREIEQAVEFAQNNKLPLFILGGGSNLVLVDDIPGLVIHSGNESISVEHKSDSEAHVTVGAGVNWHSLVLHTLNAGLPGLENLSLIPGLTGAAPVQNIGAYGVEVQEHIVSVRALHRPTLQWQTLSGEQCNFSYRHSHFKQHPDDYIINEVCFSLGTRYKPRAHYTSLQQHLKERGVDNPDAQQISESVITVRRQRLPDPAIIGNAGSFFHNPVVSADAHTKLKTKHPDMVSYVQADGQFKLAAGWLIDALGFKGSTRQGVGVHEAQALVLINRGSGCGADILALAEEIKSAVLSAYGVRLSIEPRIVQQHADR